MGEPAQETSPTPPHTYVFGRGRPGLAEQTVSLVFLIQSTLRGIRYGPRRSPAFDDGVPVETASAEVAPVEKNTPAAVAPVTLDVAECGDVRASATALVLTTAAECAAYGYATEAAECSFWRSFPPAVLARCSESQQAALRSAVRHFRTRLAADASRAHEAPRAAPVAQ